MISHCKNPSELCSGGCGRRRSFGSASLCRFCYRLRARRNQTIKRLTKLCNAWLRCARIPIEKAEYSAVLFRKQTRIRTSIERATRKRADRRIRTLHSIARRNIAGPYHLDRHLQIAKRMDFHQITPSQEPDPLQALIYKEEAEENRKWRNIHKAAPISDERIIQLREATLGHRLLQRREQGKTA